MSVDDRAMDATERQLGREPAPPPAAPALRFLTAGSGPSTSSTLTAALAAGSRPVTTDHGSGRADPPDAERGSPGRPGLGRLRDDLIAALGRLAEGVFALCDVCGAPIPDQHLSLALAADRCPDHALPRRPSPDEPLAGRTRPGVYRGGHPRPTSDGNSE